SYIMVSRDCMKYTFSVNEVDLMNRTGALVAGRSVLYSAYLGSIAPRITIKKPIGSVTVSGHKFLGCPIPCEYIDSLSRDVEYIASKDVTVTGSRCGHAPIFLWYAIKIKGLIGIQDEVHKCIMNACKYAGIGAMLNEFSNIVAFERPLDEDFIRRWNLACNGNIAHALVMQHVTIEMLDSFVAEFLQKRSILVSTSMHCKLHWFWKLCLFNEQFETNTQEDFCPRHTR
ncbi:Serine decarboxylase 1, partial [Mucuna pruriens]